MMLVKWRGIEKGFWLRGQWGQRPQSESNDSTFQNWCPEQVVEREEATGITRNHLQRDLHILCSENCLESSATIFLSLHLQQETQWEIVTFCPQREENKTPTICASPQNDKAHSCWWGWHRGWKTFSSKNSAYCFPIYKSNTYST